MTNISWENPPYHNGNDYKELCKNSKPNDFYFAVKSIDDFTMIALVPKLYFYKEKCMYDQSMFLDHILPDDFSESMESVWESEKNVDDVIAELSSMGFEENNEFSNLVDRDYD